MTAPRSILAAATALCLAGCTSPGASTGGTEGQEMDRLIQVRAAAEAIVLCQTQDSMLLRQLGAPSRDGRLHRDRIKSWIVPDQPLDLYLGVLLDSTGTVVDVYWDVPTEVPWTPTSQCGGR